MKPKSFKIIESGDSLRGTEKNTHMCRNKDFKDPYMCRNKDFKDPYMEIIEKKNKVA